MVLVQIILEYVNVIGEGRFGIFTAEVIPCRTQTTMVNNENLWKIYYAEW